MNDLINQIESSSSFADAILAIQKPRTAFQLEKFVVGQHETAGQQWAQCVLELSAKICAVATSRIDRQIISEQIARLRKRDTPISELRAQKKEIELRQLEWAELGAIREVETLWAIYNGFGRSWTRDELDAEQQEYWSKRLLRQAMLDVNATGRVGVGNQDALRMAGIPVPGQPNYIQQVEQRFLEAGNVKILIVVPTLIKRDVIERDGMQCLKGWSLPGTIQRKNYVVVGKSTADAYTDAALTAMQDGSDFILCVEDDHVIPAGTFERLWSVYQQHGPRAIVGAWYPQKREPRTGAAIVLRGGKREYLDCEGIVDGQHVAEVYAITQGFTLIPTAIFRELPQPWFQTTGCLTQDAFFSQLAREAGYKLLVDTGARIKHVDRETGRIFE